MEWNQLFRMGRNMQAALWRRFEKHLASGAASRFSQDSISFPAPQTGVPDGFRFAANILPLLLEQFNFDFFIGFGNIIDPFVDRSFGHHFDAAQEFDRAFIDRVQELDDKEIELGRIKPTHMMAAMTTGPTVPPVYKHLTPEFCVRPQTD